MNRLAIAVFALMLSGSCPIQAGAPAPRQTWQLSLFTWIKLIPAEKGALANGHPQTVGPASLAQALSTVSFVSGRDAAPLFAKAEAASLAEAMAEALSMAEPGQDLELVSTSKRDAGFLSPALSVTARVFIQDGKLNLIVHDARLDGVYSYNLDYQMPKFETGSRSTASAVILRAAGAEVRRGDWLALSLSAEVLATSPQPVPPPQTAPSPSLEERLRSLKRLWELDLITEADYTKRKLELLKGI